MKKIVFNCKVDDETYEDDNQAVILNLIPQDHDSLFFRLQSWDDEAKHKELTDLGIHPGYEVKVTLEFNPEEI